MIKKSNKIKSANIEKNLYIIKKHLKEIVLN